MMKRTLRTGIVVCLCTAAGVSAAARSEPVSKEESLNWIRHLVPLPKKVEMGPKVVVPAAKVAVIAPADAETLVCRAVIELREALGVEATAAANSASFTLTLTLGGANAAGLSKLPNNDQAYIIRPAERGDGLLLIGGEPRGLYYAAKTLQQLLKAKVAGGQVQIPLVTITDWPDLQDRGLWGGDSSENLRWMSDRKMNYDEQISHTGVDKDRRCHVGYPPFKQKMIDEGPTYGINPVPVVLHLEQLSGYGLFEAYPELQGKDGKPGTICYSNPLFVDILSQWLLLWRDKPGVKEVDVWMAENLGGQKGCQCEQCRKEDRSVLEARAIVAAWKKARKKQPDLGLRVLTSEETEKSNPKVFEQLPPTVKVWYYHSLLTYNTRERPMIRGYLTEAARKGRWLGVCANLCATVGFWQPFTGAQFIHYRMNEFVDKRLSGLLGYAVPRISHVAFNTEAAAEWSWNAKGRSPHEFALSWAVRQGLGAPEKFAEWSDTHGPVAWDVYGSEWPAGEKRKQPGKVADLLRKGKLPELGIALWDIYPVPWGDIRSVDQLERDVAQEENAVRLAREMGEATYLQESLVVQGYINALKALWELKQIVKADGVASANRDAAGRWFKMYVDALEQTKAALPAWEMALQPTSGKVHYTSQTARFVEEMITQMKDAASECGCPIVSR
jgi:hypothetical protein